MKKTGLGRGLDALIDTSHVDTNGGSSISEIELRSIVANPDQPRRTFDEEALQELADSIRYPKMVKFEKTKMKFELYTLKYLKVTIIEKSFGDHENTIRYILK